MALQWNLKSVCAEPYRALFPLGLLGAAIGLGVWIPYYLWPEHLGYPGQSHAILQIQGFLLCFIFGFLGTMLPKVLGVPPLGPVQFLIFPAGLITLMAAALWNAPLTAQAVHLALLVNFFIFMFIRWPHRRGNPPLFFVFIAAALLADLTGTLLRLLATSGVLSASHLRPSVLLQYQVFPLLLIMGVGGFLLPKLFANETIDPQRLAPSPVRTQVLAAAAGLFVLGYLVEAYLPFYPLSVRAGAAIRALVWFWFLLVHIRLHRVPAGLPPYLAAARWSLWFIGLAMVLQAIFPRYVLAWEHLIFITGILWLTLSVAARVLTAHAGKLDVLNTARKATLGFGSLVLLAALTRVTTEVWPGERNMHLALASTFALVGIALWARHFIALLFRFPGDGK